MRTPSFPSVPDVVILTFTTSLARVRAVVWRCARRAGLSEKRAVDLVIAAGEVAANTVRHARTSGTLAIWHDADKVICEITDGGFITDPLAGWRIPRAGATTGYGLWMVRRLCDKVDLRSDETGTTVRMQIAFERPAEPLSGISGLPATPAALNPGPEPLVVEPAPG
jgi:anti-sigma regulatory factor (Ser/Thr protein kinase)